MYLGTTGIQPLKAGPVASQIVADRPIEVQIG